METPGHQARFGGFAPGEGADPDLAAIDAVLADAEHDQIPQSERVESITGHADAVRRTGVHADEEAALADDADNAAASDAASGKGDQARWQP